MSKLLKVILVYDDHTQTAEGEEAERYDKMLNGAATIMHGRAYNPFADEPVKWISEPTDVHEWWMRAYRNKFLKPDRSERPPTPYTNTNYK